MPFNNNNNKPVGRYNNNQQRDNRGPGNRSEGHRNRGGGRMERNPQNSQNQHTHQTHDNQHTPRHETSGDVHVIKEDTPTQEMSEENKKQEKKPKKARLFVGNLASGTSEEEFRKLFSPYGELTEVFVHSDKGFAFVRLDTRENAEKAKQELDGKSIHGRQLRVRFATSGASLNVKNLSPVVSNELLEEAFSKFGALERAVVIVDDKGRSTTRGIVEFTRKASAVKAVQQIQEGCFLITASPRVISVTLMEQEDSEDGLLEKSIPKTSLYYSEREAPPRFAVPGTFEEQYARRWKALDDLEREQREQLERNLQASREKLESEMENCMHEHQAMMMKQDLIRRQEELERLEEQRKRELERRQQLEMARMDAHNKEMAERQHRQEILRAQIEGQTYKNHGGDGYGGHGGGHNQAPIRGGGGYARSSPNVDHLSNSTHEVMGQGGLAPAPSRFDQRNEFSKLVSAATAAVGGNSHALVQSAAAVASSMARGYGGGNGNAYNNRHHQQQQQAPPQQQQRNYNHHQQQQQRQPNRRSYQDGGDYAGGSNPDMNGKRQRRF